MSPRSSKDLAELAPTAAELTDKPEKPKKPRLQDLVANFRELRDYRDNALIFVRDVDCMYHFNGKCWVPLLPFDLKRTINGHLAKDFAYKWPVTPTLVSDIYNLLVLTVPIVESVTSSPHIVFEDGVLDTSTFKMISTVPAGSYPTLYLPYSVATIRSQQPQTFLTYLRSSLVKQDDHSQPDESLITVIQEMMGYFLLAGTDAAAAFFFVGSGSNGKSVLANLIASLFGTNQISTVSLETLTTDRFASCVLIGKRVNICNEEESLRTRADKFKAIVSGDLIQGERKYGNAFSFKPSAKFLFCTNKMPSFDGMNYGLKRRIKIIPFFRRFSPAEKNIRLSDELQKEIPAIINWALAGAKRLVANNYTFSDEASPAMVRSMQEFEITSSSVASFWSEKYISATPDTGIFQSLDSLYQQYDYWCRACGRKPMSKQNFGQELTASTGHETSRGYVNGKQVRGRYVLEASGDPPLPEQGQSLMPPISK